MRNFYQTGATMVELIVSIVIISISVSGVLMLVANTAGTSAGAMVRAQAQAIAASYMDEILAQDLVDPSGSDIGSAELGESRGSYDDVNDYDGINDTAGAVDQSGSAISGLEGYNVAVAVIDSTVNGDAAKKITVTVSYDGIVGFTLPISAYRLL